MRQLVIPWKLILYVLMNLHNGPRASIMTLKDVLNNRYSVCTESISICEEGRKQMTKLPRAYESFKRSYPKIWEAYDQLGALSHEAGPLNEKSRELVKLALSIGAKMEGAVHSLPVRHLVRVPPRRKFTTLFCFA